MFMSPHRALPRFAGGALAVVGLAAIGVASAASIGLAAPAHADVFEPVAVDDTYSMVQGTTLSIDFASGLLSNDIHASDGYLLVKTDTITSTGAELALDGNHGEFSYTPDPAFVGVRTFQYQDIDVEYGLLTGFATVSITVTAADVPDPDPAPVDEVPCAVGSPCDIPADPSDPLPPCPPGTLPQEAGTPVTCTTPLPPCDPNAGPEAAQEAGTPPTCIPVIPPCDPDALPQEASTPVTPCIPTEEPGPGTDIPCAAGAPGCGPTGVDEADPDLPQEIPTLPEQPTPVIPSAPTPTAVETTQLAHTGSTYDGSAAGLLAVAFLSLGAAIIVMQRLRRNAR